MAHYHDTRQQASLAAVAVSLLLAVALDFVPLPFSSFFWLFEPTALMLLYWSVYAPEKIGLGAAFCLGIVLDLAVGSVFGLHALSYVAMLFVVQYFHARIRFYAPLAQITAVFVALLCQQLLMTAGRLILGGEAAWHGLAAPLIGALVWPLLKMLMMPFTSKSESV